MPHTEDKAAVLWEQISATCIQIYPCQEITCMSVYNSYVNADEIWNTSYQLSVWPLSWQGGLLQKTGLSQVPCGNTSLCLLADAFGRKALPAYVALWAVTSYCHYPAPHPVEETIKTDYKWMQPCKWSFLNVCNFCQWLELIIYQNISVFYYFYLLENLICLQ